MSDSAPERRWVNFNLYVGDSDLLDKVDQAAVILGKPGASKSSVICAILESVLDTILEEDAEVLDGQTEIKIIVKL